MRWFPHGANINFQTATRGMNFQDLQTLLQSLIDKPYPTLVGTIDLTKEQLVLFGQVERLAIDEAKNQFQIDYFNPHSQEVEHYQRSLDDFVMSHEAEFTVIDADEQKLTYEVYFVTFQENAEAEITLFLAKDEIVNEPLAYVAEFWQQVYDIGRDVDVTISACSIPAEFRAVLKKQR